MAGIIRVKEGTPRRVIHLTLITVLICSLMSFVATPANATATNPGSPTSVIATRTSATTADVSFTAPTNNGGSPIESYTATSSPGGLITTITQAGSGVITFTGLTAGVSYSFTVFATNAVGNSNLGYSNATRLGNLYSGSGSGDVACGTTGFFIILDNAVAGNWNCTGSVDIPSGVTSIGEAFDADPGYAGFGYYNSFGSTIATRVDTLTISNTVTSIANFAFRSPNITSLTIPNSVTSIGIYAFQGAGRLETLTIGNGLTHISSATFASASLLASLTLGNNITSIGGEAFGWAPSLTSLTIPNSVTTIGADAFREATGLTTLNLGSGLTSIGDRAFDAAISLGSVTIPDSVDSIGLDAFRSVASPFTLNYCGNSSLAGTGLPSPATNAATCTPAPPRNLVATAGSESATIAFTAGASFGESITNYEYSLNGASYVALSPTDTTTPVAISGLTNGTTYSIRLRAVSSRGSGAPSTIISVTPLAAGLTPTFETPTATSGGFTVQISNYSPNYTWAGTATAGSVSISGAGLVTVTGVTPVTSSTATITTTRPGYIGGTAAVTATSLIGAALIPTFDSPTVTADGFSVQISNYNNAFTWSGTATASGSVAIDGSGLVTVTGVAPGTTSTATINTTQTDYASGSATVSGLSMSNVATLSALTLSAGTLSPIFSSSTTSYTASVLSSTSSIKITPTRTQGNATITVNSTTVTSGTASGDISLSEGVNTITVVGTAQDGTTTSTYTITVTRPAPPTITISTTDFQPRASTNVGVNLSNFDTSLNYQATIKFVDLTTNTDVSNGTLSATKGGTSLIPGYSSYSATKLGFKGTYAQVAAALASLTWNPATGSGNISMRIGIASMPGTNEFYYDANSGHYYKYVSTALPWVSARTASEATTLFGLRGYLAEVNSEAENFFIGRETTATNVWIGASDRTVEGTWIWDGATNAYPKPTGSGTNSGRSATFHSWANGEPNDWPWHGPSKPEREDCAVTNWQGKIGMWNDWPCLISQGYLIEFGGRPGETSTAIGATLTTVVNAVPPVQYTITYSPEGGSSTPTSPSRTTGERFALAGAITRADSGGASFQFAGWSSGVSTYKAGETLTVGISNLEFEAEWVRQYQVTYLNNGGTFAGGDTTSDSECNLVSGRPICNDTQPITLNSAPTKAGHNFAGWLDSSGNLVADTNPGSAGIQTTVTDSRYIFTASWTPITYTITYISTGSSVPTQSVLEEGEAFVVGTAGTRVGFRFDGWSDGDSIYFPGSEVIVGAGNISLTAQWIAVFSVTYSQGLGSGTPATDPASYPVGYALAVDTDAGISRSGFTFSGWSDGTTIYQVGDIYTIATSNVTLTAQWSAVPVAQAPAPTPSPTLTPTVNPISVETIAAQTAAAAAVKLARDTLQITVAKNQKTYQEIFASVTTSNSSTSTLVAEKKLGAVVNTRSESINSSQSANFRVAARNISLSNDVIEEFKSRIRITVTTTGISVTPVSGFTGVLIVPFAATVDGVETVVLNQIVVNPAPPVAQNFAPTSINRSSIAWAPSTSQTTGYLVKINGKEICQTTANSCPVAQLIGPKSVVTIAALGNDKTVSTQIVIPYVATRPIPALKVNFAVGSSVLSREQKIEIRSVARVIDTQGFTRLVVSGFTDSSGSSGLNKALSQARAKSVAAFMRTLLPKVAIKVSAFGPRKPLASNGSEFGKAQNRRTEIATW